MKDTGAQPRKWAAFDRFGTMVRGTERDDPEAAKQAAVRILGEPWNALSFRYGVMPILPGNNPSR